jgi:hypothetical protein
MTKVDTEWYSGYKQEWTNAPVNDVTVCKQGCGSASLYSEPDPAFTLMRIPIQIQLIQFYADQDPYNAPHQSDANLRPLVYRPFRAPF